MTRSPRTHYVSTTCNPWSMHYAIQAFERKGKGSHFTAPYLLPPRTLRTAMTLMFGHVTCAEPIRLSTWLRSLAAVANTEW